VSRYQDLKEEHTEFHTDYKNVKAELATLKLTVVQLENNKEWNREQRAVLRTKVTAILKKKQQQIDDQGQQIVELSKGKLQLVEVVIGLSADRAQLLNDIDEMKKYHALPNESMKRNHSGGYKRAKIS